MIAGFSLANRKAVRTTVKYLVSIVIRISILSVKCADFLMYPEAVTTIMLKEWIYLQKICLLQRKYGNIRNRAEKHMVIAECSFGLREMVYIPIPKQYFG